MLYFCGTCARLFRDLKGFFNILKGDVIQFRLKIIIVTILFFLFLPLFSVDMEEKAGTIIVRMEGFRNDEGVARITLFDQQKGFPDQYKLALDYGDSPITDRISEYIFHQVSYGAYSVGIFHDEDSNGKLKTNFLGMPREGVGVSNNIKPRFGAPKFKDCLFSVDRDTVILSIQLYYL